MDTLKQHQTALTGVSGHLGYVIHKMYERDGHPHRVFLRKEVDYINHEDTVIGTLYDEPTIKSLVKDCHTVIHCAAKVWPRTGRNQHVLDVNYGITKRLFEIAEQEGVRHFVYISSIHSMIIPLSQSIFNEEAELVSDDRLAYDYSKATSERFLSEQRSMKVTILNPTGIIGPGDHYLHGMNQLFKRIINKRLPVITSGGFNVVDVRDVARAAISAAKTGREGKFMVGGKYITMVDLASKYGAVNGLKVTKWIMPPWMMRLAAWISIPIDRLFRQPLAFNEYSVKTLLEGHRNISSARAKEELGHSNIPLEQSLKSVHSWLTEQKIDL
ncbi:MAG: NAD-dependent epimerase/dehydratase family protein [Bacteroidetes bacterium]|nr:NAD-dependent epimerase/dehydratase family protein [Bacteroidota bacterium]